MRRTNLRPFLVLAAGAIGVFYDLHLKFRSRNLPQSNPKARDRCFQAAGRADMKMSCSQSAPIASPLICSSRKRTILWIPITFHLCIDVIFSDRPVFGWKETLRHIVLMLPVFLQLSVFQEWNQSLVQDHQVSFSVCDSHLAISL